MAKTLYSTEDNKRFFHIPDQTKLKEGEAVLRSLRGKTLRVNLASVDIFEVTEERAKELAADEMEALARRAGQLMSGAGSFLRGLASGLPKPQPPPGREQRRATVADALGVTEEQLSSDPDAVIEGVKRVGEGIQQLLEDAIKDGPATDEDAKKRMDAVIAYLREQMGEEAAVTAANLPEKLREFLANPELESGIRSAAEDLRAAARRLREANEAARGTRDEG